MLRSGELLPIHRSELAVEDSSGNICVNIPFKRLKNRKHSPEPAAHEAAAERSGDGDRQRSREEQRAAVCVREPRLSRPAAEPSCKSVALRGTKHEKCKGKTKTAGLCELLSFSDHAA